MEQILTYQAVARIAWSSTYTYIALMFAAAAFIAYVARPGHRGQAEQRLYAGNLMDTCQGPQPEPTLRVQVLEGGKVRFSRMGVPGLTSSGAVSWAVTTKGKDVEVKERVSAGFSSDAQLAGASFTADLTGYEWRHVQWMDEDSGLWCAFTLHMRPGIDFVVNLRQ